MAAGRVRPHAEQVKPYTFNPAPFLPDPNSAKQGYVTSEPFAIETEGKFKPSIPDRRPRLHTYSTPIETRRETVEKKPGLVQRFVDAARVFQPPTGDNKLPHGDPYTQTQLSSSDRRIRSPK